MRSPSLLRSVQLALVALLLILTSWSIAPDALALTQIKLSDLSYETCPPEMGEGAVTSGGFSQRANCFLIHGKATNPTGKTVYDADIFGRVYDANRNPVMQNRTRLGLIEEVPPGVSDFELRISVAADQPTPLILEQFKAAGFGGRVRR
ncbi:MULTISPECIES: hypothetical protein [unclassified Roseofilum]|uniref:hypothetical protein n=1 Tax=unclassified Roseofilum TaxID=2620099 RepID=UPI001B266049|nr:MULTISPECIES: hypothetical protein [unclassified Roseofilum]MBP0008435.1 hypothetical protein [Roseofilum sp. Belize Diploria]MBP0013062.1 hypothetical protein [Roseofilum sp. SID3]MBP0023120.1 hypothetical protein [Roseofilum sp. SID2]MBP0033718.1 hypothetical protein [Roseofilum sp. Belize BBD 4]MBP0040144.1 hypothetical protein [Roseofilum sp. SID1]